MQRTLLAPLVLLAIGSIFAGFYLFSGYRFEKLLEASSAYLYVSHEGTAATIHTIMMFVSSLCAIGGIGLALLFYTIKPDLGAKAASLFKAPVRVLQGKYFIDEFYDRVVVRPLFITGQVLYLVDQLVIHATIMSVGWAPRLLGKTAQPTQAGRLQGYGLGMVAGIAAIALLLLFLL